MDIVAVTLTFAMEMRDVVAVVDMFKCLNDHTKTQIHRSTSIGVSLPRQIRQILHSILREILTVTLTA